VAVLGYASLILAIAFLAAAKIPFMGNRTVSSRHRSQTGLYLGIGVVFALAALALIPKPGGYQFVHVLCA
jgi:uncharacterized membrane protein